MNINNKIALRYLKSRKRNSILSFLSITSVIGLMLGTATLIIVVGVMSGFADNLKEKMMGSNPNIIVTNYDSTPVLNYDRIMDKIALVKGVKYVSPFVNAQAVISTSDNVSGVIVKGVDPKGEQQVSKIESFMIFGSIDDLNSTSDDIPAIILGTDLAFSINASLDDTITLISPQGSRRGPFGITPKMRKFKVKGIFDTGVYEYNSTLAYINIKTAQDFVGLGEYSATGLGVSIERGYDAVSLSNTIASSIERRIWVRDWLSMSASLFSALKLEQYAMFIVLTLIIIVASFSIVSMIAITIKDKYKDIAILRTYGASASFIKGIFIRQGIIVGILGTCLGNISAFLLSILITKYEIIKLPKDVYFMSTLPINMDIKVYILVTVCAITITFLASLYPSSQAAKMSPVDALRND